MSQITSLKRFLIPLVVVPVVVTTVVSVIFWFLLGEFDATTTLLVFGSSLFFGIFACLFELVAPGVFNAFAVSKRDWELERSVGRARWVVNSSLKALAVSLLPLVLVFGYMDAYQPSYDPRIFHVGAIALLLLLVFGSVVVPLAVWNVREREYVQAPNRESPEVLP
jgi:hypothetical protein